MSQVASCMLAASLGLTIACGSTKGLTIAPANQAGRDAGGDSSDADASTNTLGLPGGAAGFSVDIEDSTHAVLTSITLNCTGDCIDVQAVARGGVPPYAYTWSDGTRGPMRHLCPKSAATISVSVTDAGIGEGEFARSPQAKSATLTIQVLSCSEAGSPDAAAWDADTTLDGYSSEGTPGTQYGCEPALGNESDAGSAPPSCAPGGPGMTDCGPNNESCCTSLEVTGGTYYRTYTNSGNGPTGSADPATVSCLRLDKYLVTVGRFRQFVAAWENGSGYMPTAGSGRHTHLNGGNGLNAAGGGYEPGWDETNWNNTTDVDPTDANLTCDSNLLTLYATWTPTAGNSEKLPINCVNWWEAYAFCIWDGGFLPTEAEWEYAAAGGSQQREYPWGTMDPGTSNQYAICGCYYPSGSGTCTNVSNIAEVGTATQGAGLWGQLDLAGEVWEWNLDWIASSYVNPSIDSVNLTTSPGRVLKGGDFGASTPDLLPTTSNSHVSSAPASRGNNVGFRCARPP
jgi:sulfatase modifying factor 1